MFNLLTFQNTLPNNQAKIIRWMIAYSCSPATRRRDAPRSDAERRLARSAWWGGRIGVLYLGFVTCVCARPPAVKTRCFFIFWPFLCWFSVTFVCLSVCVIYFFMKNGVSHCVFFIKFENVPHRVCFSNNFQKKNVKKRWRGFFGPFF